MIIVRWQSDVFKAHEALSPQTRQNIENLHTMRLMRVMTDYMALVRSVVESILKQNAPGFPSRFAYLPPSIVCDDEGIHGALTVIATAPAHLWTTVEHHVTQTLEGLHQEVCTQ